jgi:putative acetyltransferase
MAPHPSGIIVRPWVSDDLPEMVELFTRSVHLVCCRDYSPEQLQAWAPAKQDLEHWAHRLSGLEVFVAEDAGEVVGFASWRPDGYFDHLFVRVDRQNRGIASRLADQIEHRMKDAGIRNVWVDASVTAQSFFRQRGYGLVRDQIVEVRGVLLQNARMKKQLNS